MRERKTCDCKRSTTPNHASPVHSIRIKTNTCVRANEFFSVCYTCAYIKTTQVLLILSE
ncbi:hypothetical protein PISMIDRAFT_682343 [Pisolithus microcarpus 441]|uniref:Uncharacterized protein n=1 Tax=Pisolithus microcarpus 441 TaxID=765257 RepID=A0A0C9ZKG2_9AGAM|nr:hypothetical protein PISMIDRAFT_682343 [Pisolithus microcarpus 441]